MKLLGVLFVCASVAVSASAEYAWAGDLSVWARAADPPRRKLADAVDHADRLLSEDFHLSQQPSSFRRSLVLNKARRVLERAGAERSPDPHVRYRYAQVIKQLSDVERDEDRLEQCAEHMAFVARSNAPLTVRADALNDLAICHARLGQHDEEIAAYGEALALVPHPETRAVILANRAEGYMVRGEILSAVRGYRFSLQETPAAIVPELAVTTLWGLAVALDRSGDLAGAFERIATARTYDPVDARINGPSWFYVPEHDNNWYEALGHWQRARVSKDEDFRLASYRQAVARWRSYIERAPETDRWLPLAVVRLKQCEKELARAIAGKPVAGASSDQGYDSGTQLR